MSTTLCCNTPSTQRWPLAGLSAHMQSILVLSTQQQYWDLSTVQRWVSCHSSDKVHHIFYFGPLCWDLTFRATKGHSSYQGGDHIQVGDPSDLIPDVTAGTHSHHPWSCYHSQCQWAWGALGTSSSDRPLRQAVTSRKLGVGVHH